ncbi:MAG: hypothetical protein ICV60_07810 [Pyrinomonadaceae bacterium]|nr:hypothetical protein [Pyrinomonadaceae bacterium]
MKKLQRFWAAATLILVLSFPTFAGDILCPGVTNPPPDQQQTSATGEMQNPSVTVAGPMDTPLTSDAGSVAEIALTLMVNVLSVF